MSSVDEFSAAIGTAAESVEAVTSAITAAKSNGDELTSEIANLGAEGKANETGAVAQRLETEAAPLAAQLKELLGEIRQQAEALRGLEGAPSAGVGSGGSSSAQPAQFNPEKRNERCVKALKRFGWPKNRHGKTKARALLYDAKGNGVLHRPLKPRRKGEPYPAPELREPWRSNPETTTTWHIEGGVAAYMRRTKTQVMVLYINEPICGGPSAPDPQRCYPNLAKILPAGSTLYVHIVEENGGYRKVKVLGTGEAIR